MSIEAMKQEHNKRHNCPHCEREFACNHHQWLGLTDEEIIFIENRTASRSYSDHARAIEAKLKEKNT